MNQNLYSDNQKVLVRKLKLARESAGLKQSEAAELLGKTQSYISKIESGQRRIDVSQLQIIAKVYKRKISFFIE